MGSGLQGVWARRALCVCVCVLSGEVRDGLRLPACVAVNLASKAPRRRTRVTAVRGALCSSCGSSITRMCCIERGVEHLLVSRRHGGAPAAAASLCRACMVVVLLQPEFLARSTATAGGKHRACMLQLMLCWVLVCMYRVAPRVTKLFGPHQCSRKVLMAHVPAAARGCSRPTRTRSTRFQLLLSTGAVLPLLGQRVSDIYPRMMGLGSSRY